MSRIDDLLEKRECHLSAHEHAELTRLLIEDYKQRRKENDDHNLQEMPERGNV